MKKSEKVLITIVAIAAAYGAGDYALKMSGQQIAENITPEVNNAQFAAISSELKTISGPKNNKISSLFEEIEKPWKKDVFLYEKKVPQKKTVNEEQESENNDLLDKMTAQAQSLSYSGFLTMGETSIAIIDGLDYRENEEVKGFQITQISPGAIELKKDGIQFTVKAKNEMSSGRYTNAQEDNQSNPKVDKVPNPPTL